MIPGHRELQAVPAAFQSAAHEIQFGELLVFLVSLLEEGGGRASASNPWVQETETGGWII